MNWFKKLFGRSRDEQPAPTGGPEGDSGGRLVDVMRPHRADLEKLAESLAVTAVMLSKGERELRDPSSSFAAGHPYFPDGQEWPTYLGQPMFFVAQINLADLPVELPGFPRRGLVQWFVGSDDTSGLTFDDTAGAVGREVRWFADTTAPSLAMPTDPTPWDQAKGAGEDLYAAIDPILGVIEMRAGRMLPGYDELMALDNPPSLLDDVAEETGYDPMEIWEEYLRDSDVGPFDFEVGSNVGGTASFTQADPRGEGNFPPANSPGGRVLIQLDAHQFGGWGDVGIGQLFGDPNWLVEGNLEAFRYNWDCS